MNEKEIIELVIDVAKEVGEDQDNEILRAAEENTRLFGKNLDSMGIVFMVAELEARITDEYGVDLILADERAMSQRTSPFRSVKTLSNYIKILAKDKR